VNTGVRTSSQMKTIKFKYDIADKVFIFEISRPGIVEALLVDGLGEQYKVAYWHEGVRRAEWLYDWELTNVPK